MVPMNTPLRLARMKANKTLTQVAGENGLTKGTLSKIETGQLTPSTELAERLAKYYAGAVSEIQILYPERFMGARGRAA